MVDAIDRKRAEVLSESPAVVDALLTRTAKHMLSSLQGKWVKPIENEVISAAFVFYRRFFSVQSPVRFDPEHVFLVALALACKTEESHSITLKDITAGELFHTEEATELELVLMESLDFQLQIQQPWPIIMFFCSRLAEKGKSDAAKRLFDSSCDAVSVWQRTDAASILQLSLLGFAAVYISSDSCGVTESIKEITETEFGSEALIILDALPSEIANIVNRHANMRPSSETIDSFAARCREARSLEPKRRRMRLS